MKPAARIAAAATLLDSILAGASAEKSLTGWARASRFAGSGDRAAVRDLVFDALRRRRSCAWAGGAETGRGLMLGALRIAGTDPATMFTGEGHAPAPLSAAELARGVDPAAAPDPVRLDVPDWLWPEISAALGEDTAAVLDALRARAPVFLRVNALKVLPAAAIAALAAEGIVAVPRPEVENALEVTGNVRKISASRTYREGLVELQDLASQAIVRDLAGMAQGADVLDYCAGGGGKTLALAACRPRRLVAHDAAPGRMKDLPARAARAGAVVEMAARPEGRFGLVLCDAPCSGSGAWRRQPEAKWRLTAEALEDLNRIQDGILDAAAGLVAPGGCLAYVTCSLLEAENGARAAAFTARQPIWRLTAERRLTPLDGGDGFYLAVFGRRN